MSLSAGRAGLRPPLVDEREEPEGIQEAGPWEASGPRVYSDDSTYDAGLSVTGNFADDKQRHEYAKEIARRLNEWWERQE